MKKIIISEDQMKNLLDKYTESDDKILVYLRRNYPVFDVPEQYHEIFGKFRILVDDKSIPVRNNFKNLVDRIDNELIYQFSDVGDKVRRQTIKKYLKNFEF